jgi:septal ring factor EnvC (AmiA/AmiB activator)
MMQEHEEQVEVTPDYQVIDLGTRLELSSNSLMGILKGVSEYSHKGYTFNYMTACTRGYMFCICTVDKDTEIAKKNREQQYKVNQVRIEVQEREADIVRLKQEKMDLGREVGYHKSLVTRTRNKNERLETEIQRLETEIKELRKTLENS